MKKHCQLGINENLLDALTPIEVWFMSHLSRLGVGKNKTVSVTVRELSRITGLGRDLIRQTKKSLHEKGIIYSDGGTGIDDMLGDDITIVCGFTHHDGSINGQQDAHVFVTKHPKPSPPFKTGFVYLMYDSNAKAYKIGFSKNPYSRLRGIAAVNIGVSDKRFFCDDGDTILESNLHEMFCRSRLRGEWFKLDVSQVKLAKETIKNYKNASKD